MSLTDEDLYQCVSEVKREQLWLKWTFLKSQGVSACLAKFTMWLLNLLHVLFCATCYSPKLIQMHHNIFRPNFYNPVFAWYTKYTANFKNISSSRKNTDIKLHAITCNLSTSEVTFILLYRKIKPLLQKHFGHKQNTLK